MINSKSKTDTRLEITERIKMELIQQNIAEHS